MFPKWKTRSTTTTSESTRFFLDCIYRMVSIPDDVLAKKEKTASWHEVQSKFHENFQIVLL